MTGNGLRRFGGGCAVLVGLSYLVALLVFVLMVPSEQRVGSDAGAFLASFARNPFPSTVGWYVLVFGALLSLGVIPAVAEAVRPGSEGWTRWASALGYLGYAMTAVVHLRYLSLVPYYARVYAEADEGARVLIASLRPLLELDAQGWCWMGCPAAWMLIVCILGLRSGGIPKALACMGIGGSLIFMTVVAGHVTWCETLAVAGEALGAVVGPVWYVWLGVFLRRAPSPPGASSGQASPASRLPP